MLTIQILVDTPNSWIIPYAKQLITKLVNMGYNASLKLSHDEVVTGDILCLLSCEKIFRKLNMNTHNLVVHESNLPKGKGWSPLTWQILEGKNIIPITLFEASDTIDSGMIYIQKTIELDGTELLDEIKHKQGQLTIDLIIEFIEKHPNNLGKKQEGESTFYKKRGSAESELNINKTIVENFNLLRVCDNERYPAYFIYKNCKYILKVEKIKL
ncbi:MAG: hypothetical protein M0Q53_08045 [Prolixibacteraceae bacterium]|jgi:methionyl-tRNA formyltransferase|nr:hypothetical protein [Prolixibacteraceae bacterium]